MKHFLVGYSLKELTFEVDFYYILIKFERMSREMDKYFSPRDINNICKEIEFELGDE